jgi:hypothetical protein
MERWIRMLKTECLYLDDFATLDKARQVIGQSSSGTIASGCSSGTAIGPPLTSAELTRQAE